MSVLDEIVAYKHIEVAERKQRIPIAVLEQSSYFLQKAYSMREGLLDPDKSGIITEFKRKSPAKGVINASVSVKEVTMGYVEAGASALSVLTDERFFGGSNADFLEARSWNSCPMLRKDFMVDPYQILEAKSIGADAILLIAACLDKHQLKEFAHLAKSIGLEVLMEVHNREELDHWNEYVDIVGVNNRNLKTMQVSVQTSFELFNEIPEHALPISESGLDDPAVIVALKEAGYRGFLMGEHFMKDPVPHLKCKSFIQQVTDLEDLVNNAIA